MKRLSGERLRAKARLQTLSGIAPNSRRPLIEPRRSSPRQSRAAVARGTPEHTTRPFELRLLQAGLSWPPLVFSMFCGALATFTGFLGSQVFPAAAAFFFAGIAGALPFAWLSRRTRARALEFSADYPAVLLATASSVRVGLTPQNALLRATRLLPAESIVRKEVETLLKRLDEGTGKDEALERFGEAYSVPDLELFRSAFLLVTETGGKFSPSLERLASVSNNRMNLMRMAAVSTASMRMTANVLLCIAPFLVLLLSTRIDGYWNIFRNTPAANALASAGVLLIVCGYLALRRMSNFKP